MKIAFFIYLFLASNVLAFGQSISPEVLAASGDHFSANNIEMSWTIGELTTETYDSNSIVLTQGFHQSDLTITSLIDLASDLMLTVYPNPTSDLIHVEMNENLSGYHLTLVNNLGQILFTKEAVPSGALNQLKLSSLAEGIYFLQLLNENQQPVKIFKIVKSQ